MRRAGHYAGHQDLHIALALRDHPNGHLCHWCGEPMDLTDRARALDNLVRAHKRCNEARGNERLRPMRYETAENGRRA